VGADADSRAAAEGEIGVARNSAGETVRPSFREELPGGLEQACVAMEDQLAHPEGMSLRGKIAPDLRRLDRVATEQRGRRHQTQGLGGDSVGVTLPGEVVDSRRPAVEDVVQSGV